MTNNREKQETLFLFQECDPQGSQSGQDSAKVILDREGVGFLYIRDPGIALETVAKLQNEGRPLGLDTETAKLPKFSASKQAGLDPHLSRIRLIQIYGGGRTVYVFDMQALSIELLKPLWKIPMVAHNAVFDMKHLFLAGADPRRVGCTMLMANALTGRLPSLKELAREHLGWKISKEQRTSDWSAPELTQEQLCYSALDALAVFRLFPILKDRLMKENLMPVYTLMRNAQRPVAKMELNGIHFDFEGQDKLIEEWQTSSEDAKRELLGLLGPDINLDSSKQISAWFDRNLGSEDANRWPKTKTGQMRTDGETFTRFSESPVVKPFQRYKEASKMLSTFGNGYAEHRNPKTGRIHARFRLGGTTTGRLSCSNPNIQNPPRTNAFRSLFSSPTGRALVVADYSQIELRVAALLSRDRNMLEAYSKGEDLHRKTASVVAGVRIEQVTKEQRQAAKAVNFGLLFGQGPKGLARYARTNYGVDMSDENAREARGAFFRTYPGLKRWQEDTGRNAQRVNRVMTPGGRVRDFTKEPRGYQYTEALNTPVQGGAAEVLLATLAKVDSYLDGVDARLVNVVHDEIVLEVAIEDTERAKAALTKGMIEGMLTIFPDASTLDLVEAHSGSNWAEAKESA